jgi:hypothetical protein
MTEPQLISRQRTALKDLYELISDRAGRGPRLDQEFRARNDAAEKEFQEACQKVINRFESEKEASQSEFQGKQDRIGKRFADERTAQDEELRRTSQQVNAHFEAESLTARNDLQQARTASIRAFEANERATQTELEEAEARLDELVRTRKRIARESTDWMEECRQDPEHETLPAASRPDRKYKDAFRQLEECLAAAQAQFDELRVLKLPRFFKGWRPAQLFVALFILIAVPTTMLGLPDYWPIGLAGGAATSVVLGVGIYFWLRHLARVQIDKSYLPLLRSMADADEEADKSLKQAQDQHERSMGTFKKLHDKELRSASEKYETRRAAAEQKRNTLLGQAKEKFEREKADSTFRRDTELRQAHEKYQRLRTEILERYETDSHQIHQRHYREMTESKGQYESESKALGERWQQGLVRVHGVAEEITRECGSLFADWHGQSWNGWKPANSVPPVIRFGEYVVELARLPNGLPKEEEKLPAGPTQFKFPALLPFPSRSSLVIKTDAEGRNRSVEILQAVMLRYLTSLPPGKVRFTIIDPVGLGENFAAFMHLADYDDSLVNSRIWTEIGHIEQRFADLSAHMEDVIQKYLRNQFKTIEEYNLHAGEVAEPYRIPVIANFPNNFTAEAARRLVSIVSSGARCGVYALITVDATQELPLGFQLADLEQHAATLQCQNGQLVWNDPDFANFHLQPDRPPSDEICTRILHQIGERAREANRVEVPFDFIAAAPPEWWKSDSRAGVQVALGRAGATKRQQLKLGQGTSQHVLIAGKTGSGKSTLLHALVTNVSLLYSPEEIELYLIDFKKGVEFKTYAAHELPHARVVAIESDREFGLSVLQRLDAELKVRGERFREVGAQDLNAYREMNGNVRMPRILLIVDEFQEFFIEDDKVSQDSSQLLDRLVRQGRAFGLHVLLGSQTLGGAYTLARSTIDQMAVRIALQCSEADAHLILSDDNSAARLLSRPGEAIYNDANGLVEGNNPFQVVWLPEDRREQFLRQIREMERQRNPHSSRRQIVFEGNAPAEIPKNLLLHNLIAAPAWPDLPQAYHAWLGEAMAIKDPTAAVFRRQSGSNLLIIGQSDDAALGILTSGLLSLAAQHAPAGGSHPTSAARFYILDGSPADAPHAGYLAQLASYLPHGVQVCGWRDLGALMAQLAYEVEQRQKSNERSGPEIYLFLHGLHRFRDLRKDEDDFGYSSTEQKPSPAKHFASIVREGPGLGIHVLVWCDSLNNATRALDRNSMREFNLRVLFQMSPSDSSTLIDSPLASKLGLHRAYFHSEEEGRLEKFRPYGLPAEKWLLWCKEQLGRKRAAR